MKIICKTTLLPPPQTRIVIETTPDSRDFGLVSAQHAYGPDIRVDWGDGTVETYADSLSKVVHSYPSDGVFTIIISDAISSLAVRDRVSSSDYATKYAPMIRGLFSNAQKLITLPVMGFSQCTNLRTLNIADIPASSFQIRAFSECPNLEGIIDLPNISKVSGTRAIDLPFYSNGKISEIHFAKANEAAITSSTAWSVDPTLGAVNAQIKFDL